MQRSISTLNRRWSLPGAFCLALAAAIAAGSASHVLAQEGDPLPGARARALTVEYIKNEQPQFYVRVEVDRPDRTYRVGDVLHATVRSERAGYLYLLYVDATGNCACVYPNSYQTQNQIPAGQPIVVPDPAAPFRFRVSQPAGEELLKAIVSSEPLAELQLKELTKGFATPISAGQIAAVSKELNQKAIQVEAKDAVDAGWAEHEVKLLTVADGGPVAAAGTPATGGPAVAAGSPGIVVGPVSGPGPGNPTAVAGGGLPGKPQRVGLFVGVSDFRDPNIRDLSSAHRDAQVLGGVMKQSCGLDDVRVLVNEQATLQNVARGIRDWLPQTTRPGDTVFIYWSGHGGRCADVANGDEKDGYDEYLVPHDGSLDHVATTMLLDDTFGAWLQGLDGRKLVVILDTCHSGGQSVAEKSLSKGLPIDLPMKAAAPFDFFDGELARTKDIGQRETAVLASSQAAQVSFERRERDLSIMTFCLVELLRSSNGPVSLQDAYRMLQQSVPAYVERAFPGSTQTPILVDYTTPPLYLRVQ